MELTNIGIFDDGEVLDTAGPFEVFSRTRLEAGVDMAFALVTQLCESEAARFIDYPLHAS